MSYEGTAAKESRNCSLYQHRVRIAISASQNGKLPTQNHRRFEGKAFQNVLIHYFHKRFEFIRTKRNNNVTLTPNHQRIECINIIAMYLSTFKNQIVNAFKA